MNAAPCNTQILRESNFAKFETQKRAILTVLKGQNFDFGKNSDFQKV